MQECLNVDFLVIGSGVAGLRAAAGLAEHGQVLVVTKGKISDSSTEYAQGGVAVALSDEDTITLHYEDTIYAGAGLCNSEAVRILVEEGPRYIEELIVWGAEFDKEGTKLRFTQEAAHRKRRVLHSGGDSTGREMVRVLKGKCRQKDNIKILPHSFALSLLVDEGCCHGAEFITEDGDHLVVQARATLLATGGAGRDFLETTNPPVATGDGIAMAYRAGAELMDLEFVQFHPTALYQTGAPRFLLTEALRGEGAQLINIQGQTFMNGYHPEGDLAPRDIVSRSILLEARRTNHPCVYLNLESMKPEYIKKRFPQVYSTCLKYKLDLTQERVPVLPAAHYVMGGVAADLDGQTSIRNLFAAGETACNGVHGANRLASNSILEGLVFGARVVVPMANSERVTVHFKPPDSHFDEPYILPEMKRDLLTLAWDKVGIFRNRRGLERALEHLGRLDNAMKGRFFEPWASEVQNIWLNVSLIAQAALAREESRGAHSREDYIETNTALNNSHSLISKGQSLTCRIL